VLNDPWPALLVVAGAFGLAAVVPGISQLTGTGRRARALAGTLALAAIGTGFATSQRQEVVSRRAVTESGPRTTLADGTTPTPGSTVDGASSAGGASQQRAARAAGAAVRGGPGTVAAGKPGGPITIGLIGTANAQSGAAALGATIPDQGDPVKQRDAVVSWINARGGIAGREIKVIQRDFDLTSNDPTRATTLCKAFTEDDKVFAVIGALGVDLPCYVSHKTLVIMTSSTNPSQAAIRSYAPYVWLATGPDLSVAMASEVDALAAQGWFSPGVKIAYFVQNTPDALGVYHNIVVPRIANLGYQVADMQTATNVQGFSDIGRYAADAQAAILKWKAQGIDRVSLIYPFGGALFIFAQQAEQAKFYPRYGIGSQDTPAGNQGNVPPSQFKDALGSGVLLADIDDKHSDPFPAGPAEKQCLDIMATNAQRFAARSNALVAGGLCDGFLLLWQAAANLGATLSVESWAAAAGNLGPRFQSASGLPGGSELTPGRPVVSRTYRLLKYDSACSCFIWSDRTQRRHPL
jgi:ABC-type branched-subunit amino acid transport system substrate-binding protein